jgi:hypothetical protein
MPTKTKRAPKSTGPTYPPNPMPDPLPPLPDPPTGPSPDRPFTDGTAQLPALLNLPIDSVKPYWRNPRKVTDEAVAAVQQSIDDFGYQQPIIVDPSFTIIVGHTRYQALRRLGHTEIAVYVAGELTEQQVKEYRLVDNKTGELTSWDFDQLALELQQLDRSLVGVYFPEIGADDVDRWQRDTPPPDTDPVNPTTVDFVCPSCFHSWTTAVSKAQILSGLVSA